VSDIIGRIRDIEIAMLLAPLLGTNYLIEETGTVIQGTMGFLQVLREGEI
jgi:hypothetical protein